MPKRNIHGRLEKLEAATPQEPDEAEDRKKLLSEFFRRALNAMAHIRRESIDEERWRYDLEKLRDEPPATVAAYVAALAHLRHPDEDEARDLLADLADERQIDPATLWTPVEAFARFGEHGGGWVSYGAVFRYQGGRRQVQGPSYARLRVVHRAPPR